MKHVFFLCNNIFITIVTFVYICMNTKNRDYNHDLLHVDLDFVISDLAKGVTKLELQR